MVGQERTRRDAFPGVKKDRIVEYTLGDGELEKGVDRLLAGAPRA